MRLRFRPEFLNRLDEYIIFSGLTKRDLRRIVEQQVSLLNKRLQDKRINVRCTTEALDYLAEVGYDPAYGARPLQRSVRKELETPLARELLSGVFRDGSDVLVDVVNDRIALRTDDAPSAVALVSTSASRSRAGPDSSPPA
jgi:ATP-dependent Clp protease ATP-binding subunit ClpB